MVILELILQNRQWSNWLIHCFQLRLHFCGFSCGNKSSEGWWYNIGERMLGPHPPVFAFPGNLSSGSWKVGMERGLRMCIISHSVIEALVPTSSIFIWGNSILQIRQCWVFKYPWTLGSTRYWIRHWRYSKTKQKQQKTQYTCVCVFWNLETPGGEMAQQTPNQNPDLLSPKGRYFSPFPSNIL